MRNALAEGITRGSSEFSRHGLAVGIGQNFRDAFQSKDDGLQQPRSGQHPGQRTGTVITKTQIVT